MDLSIDCIDYVTNIYDLTVAHSLSLSIVELQLHNVAIDVRLGLPSSLVHRRTITEGLVMRLLLT